MTVSVTQKGKLVRLSGTIAEVLTEIDDQNLVQVVYWSDNGTTATALCSRIKF